MDKVFGCDCGEAFASVRADLAALGAQPAMQILEQSTKAVEAGRYTAAKQLAEVAAELFHDKLYDGHWRDIDIGWRHGFWLASVLMAGATVLGSMDAAAETTGVGGGGQQATIPAKRAAAATTSASIEALRLCDIGLLLGAPVRGADLSTLATSLQAKLSGYRKQQQQQQQQQQQCSYDQKEASLANTAAHPDVATATPPTQESKKARWAIKAIANTGAATATSTASNKDDDDVSNDRAGGAVGAVSDVGDVGGEVGGGDGVGGGIHRHHNTVPIRTPKPNILINCPIQRVSCPALLGFQTRYMIGEQPVVLTNAINHWPALEKWHDLEYIKTAAGNRTVPVETGSDYTAKDWGQKLMTVGEFISKHVEAKVATTTTMHGNGSSDGQSSTSSPDIERSRGAYLAQHQLFDQIPELADDIAIPDYCLLGSGEVLQVNAWFGPKGTVSPLHHDPYHNLLAQVVGTKYVRLYDRRHSAMLYPHPDPLLHNTSQVELENPDEKQFPLFGAAPFVDCVLNPGDVLYIPPLWWHYVRSESVSFSVSFWWDGLKEDE